MIRFLQRNPNRKKSPSDRPASPNAIVQDFLKELIRGQDIDLMLPSQQGPYVDLHRTSLLDVDPRQRIVISQSLQGIAPAIGKQQIEATVLNHNHNTNTSARRGFYTTIAAFVEDYPQGGKTQEALVLAPPHEVHRVNWRSAYRVEFPTLLAPSVNLLNEHKQPLDITTTLIDLSATGALVSYRRPPTGSPVFHHDHPISLEIDFKKMLTHLSVPLSSLQSSHCSLPSLVVRTYEESQTRCYIAIQFLELSQQQEDLLHAVLLKIQQFLAARERE